MKVVCIDDEIYQDFKSTLTMNGKIFYFREDLTIGKIYDVLKILPNNYEIINDVGERTQYLKIRFITLEEHRDRILNKLINN